MRIWLLKNIQRFFAQKEFPSIRCRCRWKKEAIEKYFCKTYRREYRFVVQLPFLEYINQLWDSQPLAMKRFLANEKPTWDEGDVPGDPKRVRSSWLLARYSGGKRCTQPTELLFLTSCCSPTLKYEHKNYVLCSRKNKVRRIIPQWRFNGRPQNPEWPFFHSVMLPNAHLCIFDWRWDNV